MLFGALNTQEEQTGRQTSVQVHHKHVKILGQVAAAKTAHCAGIPCGILHGKFPERIFSFLNKLDEDSLLLSSLKF